jgi:hypothetical protein
MNKKTISLAVSILTAVLVVGVPITADGQGRAGLRQRQGEQSRSPRASAPRQSAPRGAEAPRTSTPRETAPRASAPRQSAPRDSVQRPSGRRDLDARNSGSRDIDARNSGRRRPGGGTRSFNSNPRRHGGFNSWLRFELNSPRYYPEYYPQYYPGHYPQYSQQPYCAGTWVQRWVPNGTRYPTFTWICDIHQY